jgi:membrane protein implicated in regulation of membrane protease activity
VLVGCNKKNEPTNEDNASQAQIAGTVTDICKNTYNSVKIGEQYWMAENMRCNKYDTESERPNATLSTSE